MDYSEGGIVATWLDLAKRLERRIQRDRRLHCESVYRGSALPGWLAKPLQDAEHNAGDRAPVLVVNAKGRSVGDTVCLVRLVDLERLIGSENVPKVG